MTSLISVLCLAIVAVVASAEDVAWEDSSTTTDLWRAIASLDNDQLLQLLDADESVAHVRASDGALLLCCASKALPVFVFASLTLAAAASRPVFASSPRTFFSGRGPLWWAYEYGNKEAIELLYEYGADDTLFDSEGKAPKDVADSSSPIPKPEPPPPPPPPRSEPVATNAAPESGAGDIDYDDEEDEADLFREL